MRERAMPDAILYCRVSTRQQAEEGSSLDSQEQSCRALAREKGLQVAQVLKEDWPGDSLERPELTHLRDVVRADKVDAVLCHSTDRLARNPIHLAIVAEECEKAGVQLLFVTEPLDTSPEGQLIRYVRGFAAQIEREKIRERTLRGKQAKAAKGLMPQGTGRGIYGYRYHPKDEEHPAAGKRTIVEHQAEVVRRIFEMCIEGASFHGIAQRLNQEGVSSFAGGRWYALTVRRIVTNPAYAGITYFGRTKRIGLGGKKKRMEPRDRSQWIEIDGVTPAIVSRDVFDAAQRALERPRERAPKTHREYLLRGHIFCGYCGTRMTGSCLQGRYRYYFCRKARTEGPFAATCPARYVRADRAEETTWREVATILEDPQTVLAELREQKAEIAPFLDDDMQRIRREIHACADQEQRLITLYMYGEIDDDYIRRKSGPLKQKRHGLQEELEELGRQKRTLEEIELAEDRVQEFCQRVRENLARLDFQDKQQALKALSIRVIAYHDRIEIRGVLPTYVTIEQTSA
jgi:site-specific DNA recombinase